MKQSSVTVLLTVRNNASTIRKCVESLLNQNYNNYKIYITEAYSTDKTYQILDSLRKKYSKKIVLERIHGNMSVAYNHMLKKVNTDFVAFTDGDAVCDKNWLKELMSGFKPVVVAVGGMIRNPKTENKLQMLIGRELEYRFSNLPNNVSRLPTMNLCVRTKAAKAEKFDEKLRVAQETEWGYRLNKYGRTKFNKKAIVWHYHRATWKAYIKQQYLYAQNMPRVYLSKKHGTKISGDEISNPWSAILLGSVGLFLLLSIFYIPYIYLFYISFVVTLISYIARSFMIVNNIIDVIYLSFIFFIREFVWIFGVLSGLSKVFKK
ncbi:MAG: glycosyltransferase [Candidatus Aenigmarchaeota archaeon]|nr:glycosyltransferase [Candidatus Aenigmarchaeota archaeon]